MPSSKALAWAACLAALTSLPALAFDMERDTWLLPEAPVSSDRSTRMLVDPLEYARMRATGNDQEPVYAQDKQAELIAAAQRNDKAAVEALLAEGVNPNLAVDQWGGRALVYAVGHGNVELVRVLLDAGADPDLRGAGGFTPLGRAALDGHARIARLLLRAGADVDRKSADGNTPITAATLMNRLPVVRELLAFHPDVTIWNREGRVCLGLAAEQGNQPLVQLMLDAGVDPNIMDRNGNRALFWAGYNDNGAIAKLLVDHGGESI